MRIDQGGRDGGGIHGLKWIGHDGVQAFAVQFGCGRGDQVVRLSEGKANARLVGWGMLCQASNQIWSGVQRQADGAGGAIELGVIAGRPGNKVGYGSGHDQKIACGHFGV